MMKHIRPTRRYIRGIQGGAKSEIYLVITHTSRLIRRRSICVSGRRTRSSKTACVARSLCKMAILDVVNGRLDKFGLNPPETVAVHKNRETDTQFRFYMGPAKHLI